MKNEIATESKWRCFWQQVRSQKVEREMMKSRADRQEVEKENKRSLNERAVRMKRRRRLNSERERERAD
jgi:hypothetical protein